jgi:hypothetical protein
MSARSNDLLKEALWTALSFCRLVSAEPGPTRSPQHAAGPLRLTAGRQSSKGRREFHLLILCGEATDAGRR